MPIVWSEKAVGKHEFRSRSYRWAFTDTAESESVLARTIPRRYAGPMTATLRAHVHAGRLLLDEPIDLPEGTELELVPSDDGDTLDDADRARLLAALDRSAQQSRAGETVSADEVLTSLGVIGET